MENILSKSVQDDFTSPFDIDLLEQIRSQFWFADHCPYAGERIYFENAGGSLTLKSVIERTTEIGAIPDNEHRNNAASKAMSLIVEQGLKDLSTFFGARSGTVFGGETGTECLFRLIRSAALAAPSGGNIVASSVEHPSTYSATQLWAERTSRTWIEVPFNTRSGLVSAEDYAACVTPDTRIATVIHTNPVTGIVMDIKSIICAIRAIAPECFIIVDGIQHAPHGYLEVDEYGADAYAVSMYKVYSKFNNGYAWVSERMSHIPHEKILGKPSDAWELGSRDPSALAAVSKVIQYLSWLGKQVSPADDTRNLLMAAGDAMLAHEHALIARLMNGTDQHRGLLHMPGVKVLGTHDLRHREGVVSFGVEGRESSDIVAELEKRAIRLHTRSSDIYSGNILRPLGLDSIARLSLAHYNTPQEVDAFLSAMNKLIGS